MNIKQIFDLGDVKLEGRFYNKAYPKGSSVHDIKVVEYEGKIYVFLTKTGDGTSAMNWLSDEYKEVSKILNLDDANIYYRNNDNDVFDNVSDSYRE
ncbi:hypothetical protein [Enterococcus sp. HY326]|uniref:hypothetical protein n=1 Tax=Enterococcus sp. HY326 TaxID=2971265 RepID=UPI00223F7549|nr:hypothetical protein [Enterococcus sp. HY326]